MSTAVWRLRALAGITVTATAAISFASIQHLAVTNGFGLASWLFPLTLDAVAAVGLDLWARRARAWREAAGLACVAVGLSLAANVTDHLASTGSVLAAVLGAFPPAMLGGLLLVLHRHATPAEATTHPVTQPATATTGPAAVHVGAAAAAPSADSTRTIPEGVETRAAPTTGAGDAERHISPLAPVSNLTVIHETGSKLERGRAWFHHQVATGRDPDGITAAEVDRAIDASGYSKKHISTWRSECAQPSAMEG